MQKDTCILCGQAYPAGLHILGCLICFPCEKRLLRFPASGRTVRRMRRLYAEKPGEG